MAKATAKAKATKTTAKKATRKVAKAPAAKKTMKKTVAKKTTVKKAAPVKATASKKVADVFKTPATKSQLLTTISEITTVTRKDVSAVFDCIADIVNGHIKPKGAGEFTLPGLLKIKVIRKPATKARKGINPFTREETVFKAKPARNVVKIKALKKLKDMAES
jgi:nucleoid DNA-binding protein